MQYNNIRLYPFDSEEYEDEERELNERIRVCRASAIKSSFTLEFIAD